MDTVEINASFYSWPTVAGVTAWKRQAGKRNFVYTVKVCDLKTMVQSIAEQTFRSSGYDASAQQAFTSRLVSLSNAHAVLLKGVGTALIFMK